MNLSNLGENFGFLVVQVEVPDVESTEQVDEVQPRQLKDEAGLGWVSGNLAHYCCC